MCGIGGFFGSFDGGLLEQMSLRIAHRGPDDKGILRDSVNGIGLVHQRLSIQDLSPAGHQPMWTKDNSVCIVFNGEIYNFQELRVELQKDGYVFTGNSDTEVLLNLYLKEGEKLLSKLNGIFAFAIWDKRVKKLFLARDGVGAKPLYYSETNSGFLFASEIKALLVYPEVSRELSPQAIYSHLTYLWCPAPNTILSGVKKLKAGHAMTISEGHIQKIWQYYDLPYNGSINNDISVKEAKEQVAEKIYTAVKRQLISDVPVGAFLSGGLDSSSIVAFAKKINPSKPFKCFTIDFDNSSGNLDGMSQDLPYAKRVAKHLNVDLDVVHVKSDIINRLEDMIYYLDEPQADPAAINTMLICELAKEQDIKVLLSGTGGDDIFTGYRRHYALSQEKLWDWMPNLMRQGLAGVSKKLPIGHPILRRLSKAFSYANLENNNRLVSYFFWLNPTMGLSLFSDEFKSELSDYSPASPLLSTLSSYKGDDSKLNKLLYLEGKHFLADHNLNYNDKMSMASGVEVRVPLLDQDLIALATSLPLDFKQHGKIGKWIFKQAMEPYLPKDVIYRPKTGFGVPLRYWLNNQLKPLVNDVLSFENLSSRGIFNPKNIANLLKLDQAGKIDAAYPIFSIICIELWCRIFIDGNTSTERH